MGRRHHRGRIPSARAARRAELARRINPLPQTTLPRLRCADRRSLLAGTALASTLLLSSLLAPTPAHALTNCLTGNPPPGRIAVTVADDIICINVDNRFNNVGTKVIDLTANGGNHYITLFNSGTLDANNAAGSATGIHAITNGVNGPISIVNSGVFAVTATSYAYGIDASTPAGNSPLAIENSGGLVVTSTGSVARGILGQTFNGNSPIDIENSGAITATSTGDDAYGIFASTDDGNSPISIVNSGALAVTAASSAYGIDASTFNGNSPLGIVNSGGFVVTSTGNLAFGIRGQTFDGNSPLSIVNSGGFVVTSTGNLAFGIRGQTYNGNSPLAIENSGGLVVTSTVRNAYGIAAYTLDGNSPISIENSGDFVITSTGSSASGVRAAASDPGSPISIVNSGNITATGGGGGFGIVATTTNGSSAIAIENRGDISATAGLGSAFGIYAKTTGPTSPINITNSGAIDPDIGVDATTYRTNSSIFVDNSGDVEGTYLGIATLTLSNYSATHIINSGTVTSTGGPGFLPLMFPPYAVYSIAIGATTLSPDSDIIIENSGTVKGLGPLGVGIGVLTGGARSGNLIVNAGSVYGGYAGVQALSYTGTKIVNSGNISAGSFFAIEVIGASAEILNAGRITGFVILTNDDDTFINQKGGVFETKLTSYFNGGDDLFHNAEGGTVLAATDPKTNERSSFVGLERFENAGLITMQDGHEGDSFEISNTVGGRNLKFIGSGNSTLGIDAFLGGPGSTSDTFIINGDVSGGTAVKVANTNHGPGVFNNEGIPVVYVNGNVKGDEFFLSHPIDAGFFDYDLFFRPTGSGVFELRSFLGAQAFVLPQLITTAQDLWHQGSDTWFDRTADLRVLLNGGVAPAEYPGAKYAEGTPPQGGNITPAMWVRGSGNWLNRDDSETVTAFGRSFRFNLNRDLETIDFQSGIDLGKRGLLSENDILVFGALGGFVHADLDYDAINRAFDYQGGQVGGYATYLRGGLFVDTLLNVHLMEIDTGRTLGFPNSLDATTVGVRTDSGYRFGSFNGGAFIEPLATISINWADIDGFSVGGNRVSFDDDPNVRGRLGLRVGTSMPVWAGTTMEPFVIGSLWGNLSDDNQATLVSTGTTFILKDDLQDVWGEVSAGVNFFNPSASTSVFAKLDVTFGDDIDGVGGKAGMRVSW